MRTSKSITLKTFVLYYDFMRNPLTFAKKTIRNAYHSALRSIAFYPVFISLGLFLTAISTLIIEDVAWIVDIKQKYPFVFIEDIDTARTILSTLIAGILSLTVFSFTMVMVVLNQASANFSPRLLPGLVSNRRHQIILGCYIGTLLYATVVLISLGAYELEDSTVGLSTTIAAILGVSCVGLFVSFIHNISSAIQIQNIISSIYQRTQKKIEHLLTSQITETTPLQKISDDTIAYIFSDQGGYFHGFDHHLVDAKVIHTTLHITVIPYKGKAMYKGEPLLKVSRILSDEEKETVLFACTISNDLHQEDYPLLGLIKLMEVAVRAMSPGVNDPGTALDVVQKLTPLLAAMIRLPSYTSYIDEHKGIVVMTTNIATTQLLAIILQPIRLYSKNDNTILKGLIKAFHFLNNEDDLYESDKLALKQAYEALKIDIEANITNAFDKQNLLALYTNKLH